MPYTLGAQHRMQDAQFSCTTLCIPVFESPLFQHKRMHDHDHMKAWITKCWKPLRANPNRNPIVPKIITIIHACLPWTFHDIGLSTNRWYPPPYHIRGSDCEGQALRTVAPALLFSIRELVAPSREKHTAAQPQSRYSVDSCDIAGRRLVDAVSHGRKFGPATKAAVPTAA